MNVTAPMSLGWERSAPDYRARERPPFGPRCSAPPVTGPVRPTMRKPKGNPKMASSSSDTSLDVGSSSGSDSDDEQLGHDGWGDRGGGGWEDRDHEASPMAMNGQDAAFEDAMAAACRNAESDEAKRNSQGSARGFIQQLNVFPH